MSGCTHHAGDDFDRMIKGNAGAESVFYRDKKKGVIRRGASEGLGVHI
jgi:hypothetical protein